MRTALDPNPPGAAGAMPTRSLRSALLGVSLLVGAAPLAAQAEAVASELDAEPAFSLSLGVEIGIGGFATDGANFRAGRVDLRNDRVSGDSVWGEGSVKPGLDARYTTAGAAEVYAGLSAVAAQARCRWPPDSRRPERPSDANP
jgi:hypothetical protein